MERRSFEKDVYSASSDSEIEREEFDAQRATRNENAAEYINRRRNVIIAEMDKLEENAKYLYRIKEVLEEAGKILLDDIESLLGDTERESLLIRRISEAEVHNNLLNEHTHGSLIFQTEIKNHPPIENR